MASEDDFLDSSELLISEVQKRPLLYDISLEDYNDRSKKAKCWEEVYKQMITNWSELSSAEKNNRGRIIQKRWRSIRDSFMKAYKKMNKIQSKKASAKRKRYVYFDQMMFIIPSIEKRKNSENLYEDINVNRQPDCSNYEEENTNDLSVYNQQINEPTNKVSTVDCERNSLEFELVEALTKLRQKTYKPQEIDEDKMFLLSLLPSFKKMNQDIKLATRIEVLQIIRQALQPNTYTSVTQSVPTCQQQTYPVPTRQQSITEQWPSCQQNANPPSLPSWTVSNSEPTVDSHILDLYQ